MEYRLWIDGRWVDSQGGGRMAIENRATEEKMVDVVSAQPAGDYQITKHMMVAHTL